MFLIAMKSFAIANTNNKRSSSIVLHFLLCSLDLCCFFFFADGDWKVWVSTAETATNADVGLVVYGDKSNSGMIIIGSSGSKTLFQADNTDEFKVRCFKRFSFSFMC